MVAAADLPQACQAAAPAGIGLQASLKANARAVSSRAGQVCGCWCGEMLVRGGNAPANHGDGGGKTRKGVPATA